MPVAILIAMLGLATPVVAQDLDPVRVEKRVTKLESEVRAVQRKVFPGGDPRYFEPEITAPAAAAPAVSGTPATAPLVDLAERVGQLETQQRGLIGQVEAVQFENRQLKEQLSKLRGDIEFRLTALEGGNSTPAPAPGAVVVKPPAKPVKLDPAAKPKPEPAVTADAAWKSAYANVIAKDWPATETAMTDFLAAWPNSTRLPQARYWLASSFAERNQHAQAARNFLELYQTAPKSDRAPDSLLGLANAMQGLKKPKDACRVLGELQSVYGPKLTPALEAKASALRDKAKCGA